MLDFDGYDTKLLFDILYDSCPPQSPEKARTFTKKFTKDIPPPAFAPISTPPVLQIPQSNEIPLSSDPLSLLHNKELSSLSSSASHTTSYLSIKQKHLKSALPATSISSLHDLSAQLTSPTCGKQCFSCILIGNFFGTITIFSLNFTEIRAFASPKLFGSVTCLDLSTDEQFLIVGYSTGNLALWDFKTGALLKSSSLSHSAEVLKIQFWKGTSQGISCDVSGKIVLVECSRNFLGSNLIGKDLIQGEYGKIYDLQILNSESDQHSLDMLSVCAIVTNKGLILFTLVPEITFFYNSPRPDDVPELTPAKLAWKLVRLETEFYTLSVGWVYYIVIYKVNFPTHDGIEVFKKIDLCDALLDLVWLSDEVLFVSTDKKDLIFLMSSGQVISDSSRKFELISRESGNEKISKGVLALDRKVFLIGKKEASVVNLLTWAGCMEELASKGEWLDVLCFGISLYRQGFPSYFGSPDPEELRNILEQMITMYVRVAGIEWRHKISNTIEYCVEIDAIGILFNMLMDYFVDYGGKEGMNYFLSILEPYILTGKIREIPSFVLGKIMVYYIRGGNEEMIEKILLNIDKQSIDSDQVMPIIKEYKFFTIGIVICCKNKDFISPIKMMVEGLLEETDGFKKSYLFYKNLWYLRLCFLGEYFLHGKIEENIYKEVVKEIVGFVLENDLIDLFMKKDAVSTLKVFYVLFELDLVEDYQVIIRKFYEAAKHDEGSLLNFCLFVARISEKSQVLIETDILFAISYRLIKLKDSIKSYSLKAANIDSYINSISYKHLNQCTFTELSVEEIGNILLNLLNSSDPLLESQQKALLECNKTIPHIKLKTFLLDLQRDYEKSLMTFLESPKHEEQVLVFEWLNLRFKESSHEDLRNKTVDQLSRLVKIDPDKTAHLVKDWFKNSHIFIIKKLDQAPDLQLKYLSELPTSQLDRDLLLTYIRLLCEYDQKKLSNFLKKFENDYIDETLEICQTYSAISAEAILYEKQGVVNEALNKWSDLIQISRHSIKQKVLKKELVINKDILDLGKLIKKYSKVCIRNSKSLGSLESDDFWFRILWDTLECFKDFKDFFYLYPHLDSTLHSSLDLVLESMLEQIDLNNVIKSIASRYKNFQFKYIRNSVYKALERMSNQTRIRQQALSMIRYDTACNVNLLYASRLEGHASDFFYCRSCGKKVREDTGNIRIFACGHVFHRKCQDMPTCLICSEGLVFY